MDLPSLQNGSGRRFQSFKVQELSVWVKSLKFGSSKKAGGQGVETNVLPLIRPYS